MAVSVLEQAIEVVTAKGKPFETMTVRSDGVDFVGFVNAPRNLRALFEASLRFERDFYVYKNERYSYEDAWRIASQVGQRLVESGVQKGDRVGISLRNYPEWIFAFMGITSIGAVAVAMNAWWNTEEMVYGVKDSGLKLLFVDQERLDRISDDAERLGVELVTVRSSHSAFRTWEAFLAGAGESMPDVDVDPSDYATLLYTSGSTGRPKGVISRHLSITNALLGWEAGGAIGFHAMTLSRATATQAPLPQTGTAPTDPPSTILSVPLFHVTGLVVQLLSSFRSGRKLIGMYKWDVEEALRIIESERVTSFNGVPTMAYELVRSPNLSKYDLSSLQSAGGGGAAMAPEQAREIDRKVAKGASGTGWGMTETQGLATFIGGDAFRDRPRSCGRAAHPIVKVKAVDEAGNTCAAGESGELCIWGIMNFSGYWQQPQATAETLIDGWVHTGDIGHVDEEGYVFITDRKKDIVIRGGENIGCQEVEATLYDHPEIVEACVFGVPDARLGETLATVVCVAEDSSIQPQEIREFVRGHLAHFKIPEHIWITTERLPRTATEKIFKRQIRADALELLQKTA